MMIRAAGWVSVGGKGRLRLPWPTRFRRLRHGLVILPDAGRFCWRNGGLDPVVFSLPAFAALKVQAEKKPALIAQDGFLCDYLNLSKN